MATKDQCEFFRSLYEEEEKTAESLESRAKTFLGVITAFLASFFLKAKDLVESAEALRISFKLLVVEGFLLTAALVFVIYSLRIRIYESPNDGPKVIEAYEGDGPTDEEFFEARAADYAVAASRNRKINEQKGFLLECAGWIIIAAVLWLLLIAIKVAWRQ
jgi:hypothetical protein